MYFVLSLWYSRWRALILLGVLCLVGVAVAFMLRALGEPTPSPTPPIPSSAPPQVPITWSFAPLGEDLQAPSGTASPALLTTVDPASARLLAEALEVGGLTEDGDAWSGHGLFVTSTGSWSYVNPDVEDIATGTGCAPGSVCTSPAGSLPPAVEDLPEAELAIRRASEILSIGGNTVDLLSARRDSWRAVVEMHLRKDGVGVGVYGRVVFGPGGAVLSASGSVASFVVDFSAPYQLPSATEGLARLTKSGVRLHEGSRTPQSGEVVRVLNVMRVSYKFADDAYPLPILAYEDEYGNVWGLAERNPAFSPE
jgi:hypothetical protein